MEEEKFKVKRIYTESLDIVFTKEEVSRAVAKWGFDYKLEDVLCWDLEIPLDKWSDRSVSDYTMSCYHFSGAILHLRNFTESLTGRDPDHIYVKYSDSNQFIVR